jgi:murein DD-endopeptidase MepM/ murein hydrolase activator NlpD
VDHGYGFKTLYAHLQNVNVKVGQKVNRGTVVGSVGRTGLAQGYHLHYEVIQNGQKVNPVYYFFNDLTPEEYDEVLEASYAENQCLS